jgi:excisionase family DNA binding protein
VVTSLDGRSASFPLVGQSVAGFHAELQRALRGVGVGPGTVDISAARPFDLPDSDRPFAEDTEHASYDPAAVTRYWHVVDKLNASGLTTGHGRAFDVAAVQWIRHAYHIPAPTPYAHGEISVAEAAQRLGCSNGVVYDWIKTGKLVASHTSVFGPRRSSRRARPVATEHARRTSASSSV